VIGAAAAVLARRRDWPYLNITDREWQQCRAVHSHGRMVQPISTQQELLSGPRPSRGIARMIVAVGAGLGAALLLGALVLWFHYGTAVFFEMISSGIAACF
jgi:hypothetical protein